MTGSPGALGRGAHEVPRAGVGRLLTAWRTFWRGVRTATGDDAYERYLQHHESAHPGEAPLSRRAFFEAEQRRKWSRINRCC